MIEISNKDLREKALFSVWKKYLGKYAYFTYESYLDKGKIEVVVFFVAEVKMVKDDAKVKLIPYDLDKKELNIYYCKLGLIRTLKDKWKFVSKRDLDKTILLEKL